MSAAPIEQQRVIKCLSQKCPGIKADDFNGWIRNKSLILDVDFVNIPGQNGKKKEFHHYYPHVLPKIHRLYHYSKIRNLPPKVYIPLANLEDNLKVFAIFLESDHHSRPENPALLPAQKIFQKLAKVSDGIFDYQVACSVYGGDINAIALCKCVDETDLSLYMRRLEAELRKNKTPALLRWKQIVKSHVSASIAKNSMKAIVIVGTSQSSEGQESYKKLKGMTGVLGAYMVHGGEELILVVEAKDEEDFAKTVVGQIRTQDGVLGTRTYIVVPGYDDVKAFVPAAPAKGASRIKGEKPG